jgi:hypothetical protein
MEGFVRIGRKIRVSPNKWPNIFPSHVHNSTEFLGDTAKLAVCVRFNCVWIGVEGLRGNTSRAFPLRDLYEHGCHCVPAKRILCAGYSL